MIFLKIIFVLLLCLPVAYLAMKFITQLIDQLLQQKEESRNKKRNSKSGARYGRE